VRQYNSREELPRASRRPPPARASKLAPEHPRLVNLEIAGYGSVAFEDMKAAATATSF